MAGRPMVKLEPVATDEAATSEATLPTLCRERYREALSDRQPIEAYYDEATKFSLPGRGGFSLTPEGNEAYDDTAIHAVPEFASSIQAAVVPPFSQWVRHFPGQFFQDEEQRQELIASLSVVDRYIFSMIDSSKASVETHECFIDLALGTGIIRVDPGASIHPLNFRSIAPRNFSFTTGPDGAPDGMFETRRLTAEGIRVEYPDAMIPSRLFEEKPGSDREQRPRATVVEGWIRLWETPSAERWVGVVFFPDADYAVGRQENRAGQGAVPYIPFRWSKGSGESWGRGPLFNLLPSLRTVNFAMSAVIDHADLALAGLWNYDDDGVINPDTFALEPGTMVPRSPGSRGLENLRPGQDFNIQQFMLEEHRASIRKALYVDELGDPNKSPKTATEVQQRMANLARRIGSSYNRLTLELAIPLFMRVTRILKDRGLIKLPAVDNDRLVHMPSSPLSQAQTYDELERLNNALMTVANAYGPEAVALNYNQERTVGRINELFMVDPVLLNSKDEKKMIAETTAQAMAAAQGQGGPPSGEEVEGA